MKERDVVFAPEAEDDLLRLYDYIAEAASPNIAIGYIERVEKTCMSLSLASERGTSKDHIRSGLRIIGVEKRTVIAFTVSHDRVTILRIFHGGRNWEVHLQ